MKHIVTVALIFISATLLSQSKVGHIDTLKTVTITANKPSENKEAAIDLTLEKCVDRDPSLSLICRGGYADEIVFRGLSGFQTNTLIDGMRMYGACTDKMDPVSSYVDKSNLSELTTEGTLENGVHGLDLRLNKGQFVDTNTFTGETSLSYSTNGQGKKALLTLSWNRVNSWLRVNGSYTASDDYFDGSGKRVEFTQFEKYNMYVASGFRRGSHRFEALVLADLAYDIGYAALPMDVSSAESVIAKVQHDWQKNTWRVSHRLYANSVTHVMDDTKRPEVVVHMDMPGWSKTLGLSGEVVKTFQSSSNTLSYELFQNYRKAEMTMYFPGEIPMYMETWPAISRQMASVSSAYKHYLGNWTVGVKPSVSMFRDILENEVGIDQFEVFGYDLSEPKNGLAGNLSVDLSWRNGGWKNLVTAKGGTRGPELSERFGFYLFNAQDGFDYIGNPDLKNEAFVSISNTLSRDHRWFELDWSAYAFGFDQYMFALADTTLSTMTIGANGVKVYQNTGKTFIVGSEIMITMLPRTSFPFTVSMNYRYGENEDFGYLPQMSPFEIRTLNQFNWDKMSFGVESKYASRYTRASTAFGELQSNEYWLLNMHYNYRMALRQTELDFQIAATNVLNETYTSHLNWGGIKQRGRNIEFRITYRF